ncbi:MAG: hypothetical protein JXR19_10125 [Bacteroidia bacterium]
MANSAQSILNPTVFISSFEWREPVTTLTDFLVALAAMYALYKFISYKGIKSKQYKIYQTYFLCFAIGMTSAAFMGHGFQAYVSPRWKAVGWVLSATGQLFFIIASINQLKMKWSLRFRRNFKTLAILKYFTFLVLIAIPATSSFKLVQLNSSLDLIGLILPLQWLFFRKTKLKGSLFIIGAIVYAMIPGIIYSQQWSVSRWFNYHDISHVMMSIFILMMFYGSFNLVRDERFKELMIPNTNKL